MLSKIILADPLSFVKEIFHPQFDLSALTEKMATTTKIQKVIINFFFQFEDYIKSKYRKATPRMLKVYNNTMTVLFPVTIYQ